MQAIHHAAVGGHVELVILLIEQFGVSPQEKADVCSQPFPCVASLVCLHKKKQMYVVSHFHV